MEFGPRALGARSILGDARSPTMQKMLNLKVKYREVVPPLRARGAARACGGLVRARPRQPVHAAGRRRDAASAAATMTADELKLWGIDQLNVVRSDIPAVTHVDYSARIQTVHADTNPRFHRLLDAFQGLTGCPVLVNTSFNVRGEPIVCTPEDAFRCFMGTDIEVLAIGNCLLRKARSGPGAEAELRRASSSSTDFARFAGSSGNVLPQSREGAQRAAGRARRRDHAGDRFEQRASRRSPQARRARPKSSAHRAACCGRNRTFAARSPHAVVPWPRWNACALAR